MATAPGSPWAGSVHASYGQGVTVPKVILSLCDSDLENLRASGLNDRTIASNGIKTENDAMVFPYRDLNGTKNCFARYRPHKPPIIDGREAKYIQPPGSPLRAYFPVASLPKLRDGVSPVFITEGEKKTLALSQLGLAAVGIGGFWSGCQPGTTSLINDLAAIPWSGRESRIVFDYDPKPSTQQDSNHARQRLAKALRAAGAKEVYSIDLQPGPDGAKQGVDDFLVANGEEAFHELPLTVVPVVFGVTGVTPPTLGEAAYYGPMGEFLRAVAPHTEATDAGILAHLLPAIGTIIGPGPHIPVSGAPQPARLNTVIVGPTYSGRKGTALVPVDKLMERLDPDFWRDQKVRGLSTGEGLIARVADIKTWNVETKEWDIEPTEKRLCVIEEEYSKVLAHIRRDGNILSQILRESFDSGNLSVLTRKDPLQAFGAHISVVGHITPEELLDRFNHIEMANGFGNRSAWFFVYSDKVYPFCESIPELVFKDILPPLSKIMNHRVQRIPLAPASRGVWEKIYTDDLRIEKPGFVGAMLARGSSIVLRTALIYYLLDPPPKGGSQGILPVHLDAAMAVWRYCCESVEMLFAGRAGTGLGDRILSLLAGGPMTRDEFNPHLSAAQKKDIGSVLAALERANLVRRSKRQTDGRPATVWELVE
jgi:hypothetical protein